MNKNKTRERWREDMERDLKAVDWFKSQMIKTLGHNSDKKHKHWLKCSYDYLFSRLQDEVKELQEVLFDDKISYKHKKIILESSDVGNFSMMIADKAQNGHLF